MRNNENPSLGYMVSVFGLSVISTVAVAAAGVKFYRDGETERKEPACAVKLASGSGVDIIRHDLRDAGDSTQGKTLISDGYKVSADRFTQAGNFVVVTHIDSEVCKVVGGIVVGQSSAEIGAVLNQNPATGSTNPAR